jgi:hypothetical protein
MHTTLLTTLVDEKHIMRYLNTIAPTEYKVAKDLLADCLGFAILTTILPFYEKEYQRVVVGMITVGTVSEQTKWLAAQPEEVQISIQETVERTFLSLT